MASTKKVFLLFNNVIRKVVSQHVKKKSFPHKPVLIGLTRWIRTSWQCKILTATCQLPKLHFLHLRCAKKVENPVKLQGFYPGATPAAIFFFLDLF